MQVKTIQKGVSKIISKTVNYFYTDSNFKNNNNSNLNQLYDKHNNEIKYFTHTLIKSFYFKITKQQLFTSKKYTLI